MNNHQLSVKSYPLYKDSAIAWLGDVPEHWEVKKFNHIAYIVEGQMNNPAASGRGIKFFFSRIYSHRRAVGYLPS